MYNFTFVGNTDMAEVALWAFTLFFIGLILYLRREDRREGYPLEDDVTGKLEPESGLFFTAQPKTFRLAHGDVSKPDGSRDSKDINARRTAPWSGSPYEPVGDPLQAGVGPGSYAHRAKVPELTLHGDLKIVPLRVASDFWIEKGEFEMRGVNVVGVDGKVAGTVSDIWVDRSETLIRYIEVQLASDAARRVLVPMPMVKVDKGRRQVKVFALAAAQFAGAPVLSKPDQITLFEEELVSAYFGAGYLYATPARSEPLI
jgi:photosynthetic reaction center H subunit